MADQSPRLSDGKRHYNASLVWTVVGMSLGAMSYAYAGAIIGTTLGEVTLLRMPLECALIAYFLGQPSFNAYMGLATRADTEGLIGTMTGLFYVGGVVGCVLTAWMADRFGRKITAATGAAISLVATACLAGSVDIGMFIAFRFFVGVG